MGKQITIDTDSIKDLVDDGTYAAKKFVSKWKDRLTEETAEKLGSTAPTTTMLFKVSMLAQSTTTSDTGTPTLNLNHLTSGQLARSIEKFIMEYPEHHISVQIDKTGVMES